MSPHSPTTTLGILRQGFSVISNTNDTQDLDRRNGWFHLKENPPPPSYDDYDPFKPLEISGRLVSTTKVVYCLLKYSFDVQVVGKSLWDCIVASPCWDKKGTAPGKLLRTVTQGDWYTRRVTLVDGTGIDYFAASISGNKELRKIIYNWANKYWRNLLIPFCECSNISIHLPTEKSRSSSDSLPDAHQELEHEFSLREKLILRDGYTSAVGLVTEERAPPTYRLHPSAGGIAPLVNTYIIPYNSYKNPNLLEALLHYSGNRIPSSLLTVKGITTDPSNAFLLDATTRMKFADFSWCIDVSMNNTYRIKYFSPYLPSKYELMNPNNSALEFGKGIDKGNTLKLPSSLLLQIHCSLARILHASGTADVISQVVNEELAIKEAGADGMSWGPTGESYLMRKLEEAAFRLEPGVYDDDDTDDANEK